MSKTPPKLLPLRDDPRWHEVILLTLGFIGVVKHDQEAASELLDHVAHNAPTPLEPLFQSHLRLAAACIADDVGVKRSLADRLIGEFAQTVARLPYPPFVSSFASAARAMPRLRPSEETFKYLTLLVRNENHDVRTLATRLICNLAPFHDAAFAIRREMLDSPNAGERFGSAYNLARSGERRPVIIRHLATPIYGEAREMRDALLTDNPDIIEVLYDMLRESDDRLRGETAMLLLEFGWADERIVEALVSTLGADDLWLRTRAARALIAMNREKERVAHALLNSLDMVISGFYFGVLHQLDALGIRNDRVIEITVRIYERFYGLPPDFIFEADERTIREAVAMLTATDPRLKHGAIQFLAGLKVKMDQVIGLLYDELNSEEPLHRLRAARTLIEMHVVDETIIDALVYSLRFQNHMRLEAINMLVRLGHQRPRMIQILLSLTASEESWLRVQAAEILKELGYIDDQVIDRLLSNSESRESW